MSVQSKMTDIADATRKLSGASGLLDLDEIIFHQEHVGTSLDGQGRDIFNAALSLASAGFGDPIYDPDYELRDNNTIYKQEDAVEHVEAQAETALDTVEDMGALVGGMQVVDAPRIMTAMGGLISDANTKTGQSDATLTAAVQRLIAGYGGGGGIETDSGQFTLADDYAYTGSAVGPYTGRVITTRLSKVDAVFVWSEKYHDRTQERPCFGMFFTILGDFVTADAATYTGAYSFSNGINATASGWYAATQQGGIIMHEYNSSVQEGTFGIRVHTAGYPIRAGDTVHWIAWKGLRLEDGEE